MNTISAVHKPLKGFSRISAGKNAPQRKVKSVQLNFETQDVNLKENKKTIYSTKACDLI